jgi:hypothetical protein
MEYVNFTVPYLETFSRAQESISSLTETIPRNRFLGPFKCLQIRSVHCATLLQKVQKVDAGPLEADQGIYYTQWH